GRGVGGHRTGEERIDMRVSQRVGFRRLTHVDLIAADHLLDQKILPRPPCPARGVVNHARKQAVGQHVLQQDLRCHRPIIGNLLPDWLRIPGEDSPFALSAGFQDRNRRAARAPCDSACFRNDAQGEGTPLARKRVDQGRASAPTSCVRADRALQRFILVRLCREPPVVTAELATIVDFIRYGASRFSAAGLTLGHGHDSPIDEATHLVLSTLHLPPDLPPAYGTAALTAEERAQVLVLIERRVDAREPVAYLVGEAWFAGMNFKSDRRALVPRSPFAELIAAGIPPWPDHRPVERALGLRTGSGCIGLAMAKYNPGWH